MWFCSYNAADAKWFAAAHADLDALIDGELWVDTLQGVVAGQSWPSAIGAALERAEGFLVFIGPSGIGPTQQKEIDAILTFPRDVPVIPVVDDRGLHAVPALLRPRSGFLGRPGAWLRVALLPGIRKPAPPRRYAGAGVAAAGLFGVAVWAWWPSEPTAVAVNGTGMSILATEVTVAQYAACIGAQDCAAPSCLDGTLHANARLPRNCVTPGQAEAYCAWLGRRWGGPWTLPTTNQLETILGRAQRPADMTAVAVGIGLSAQPVASRAPLPAGVYDLLGNLWEITADCEDADPEGSTGCEGYLSFGGSSGTAYDEMWLRRGSTPAWRGDPLVGFRCVVTDDEEDG